MTQKNLIKCTLVFCDLRHYVGKTKEKLEQIRV
jgi:hypothetical protein